MTSASDDYFVPRLEAGSLTGEARRAVLVATLNVVLGAVSAWRVGAGEGQFARAALRGPEGSADIWGSRRRAGVAHAAMINGASAHYFAYDDTADVLLGHPGPVLAPALLALPVSMSVDEYVAAFGSGYEAMVRLARIINPDHYLRGFHATSTLGAIGAANATAVAYDGDLALRTAAASLAVSRAGGVRVNIGSAARCWHAGFAAAQGAECGLLALDGVSGSAQAVTGHLGFLEVYSGGRWRSSAHWSAEEEPPALDGSAVLNLKEFPCCGAIAPALNALRAVVTDGGITDEDIVRVDVRASPLVGEVVTLDWPRTVSEAGFSLLFGLAVVMDAGDFGPWDLTEERVASGALRRLSQKVAVELGDVGTTKYETEVVVTGRTGPLGSAKRPGVGGVPASGLSPERVVGRWSGFWPKGRVGSLEGAAVEFLGDGTAPMHERVANLVDVLLEEGF
ncbi:MAG: MmgE/PrpD family protein [Candidatus Dormibacteria bacterium]